jgi:hypothetical protein
MKLIALLSQAFLLFAGREGSDEAARSETPEVYITRAARSYSDFTFQLEFRREELPRKRFQIYQVVVAIRPGKRARIAPVGYVEVWREGEFAYSCEIPQAPVADLPEVMKTQLPAGGAMLFSYRINPKYVQDSWFNYQVLRDDGSVEMNCVIRLREFLDNAPTGVPEGGANRNDHP